MQQYPDAHTTWPLLQIDRKVFERFAKFTVAADDGSGCVLWTGQRFPPSGYGAFAFRGRNRPAHRVAMMLHTGREIPKEYDIAHECRQKHCVSVSHLKIATRAENMRDRHRDGTTNRLRLIDGVRTALTDREVAEIRADTAKTHTALAAMYATTAMNISYIRRYMSHKNVFPLPLIGGSDSEDGEQQQ